MPDPFLGEIRLLAGNYAPAGWALCQGQILAIQYFTALYSLLGTRYGGDGKTTFALPDLRGSVPVDQGQGSGLDRYNLGQSGGEIDHTLSVSELPAHTHSFNGSQVQANAKQAAGNYYGAGGRLATLYGASSSPTQMAPYAVMSDTGDQPHSNQQPYLVLSFIIALEGLIPQRP